MRPSAYLLAAGLAAAATAQEPPLEEYSRYLAQAEIISPSPTDRIYNNETDMIAWGLPSNVSSPSNLTRFEVLSVRHDLYLIYMYRTDEDNGQAEDPAYGLWSTTSVYTNGMVGPANKTEFGAVWPNTFLGPDLWLESLVELLGDESGWEEVGDLRGGKRFKFRLHVTPYDRDDTEDRYSREGKMMESGWFDIDGVEGYTPGQEGAEWSVGGKVELPGALLGVAAVVAAWVL